MTRAYLLDDLNLNDHVLYWAQQGFDPGEPALSYDEFTGPGLVAVQRNVVRAHLIELSLPVDVRATAGDEATLWAGIDAINAKIRGCTSDAPKTLWVGARSYAIVTSREVMPIEDDLWDAGIARLTLLLNRR